MAIVSWRSGWFCLTIRDRLAVEGSHLTVDLPELSVTVQHFRGGLRGFWNVCSHRGTQMRAAGCGSGPLRCPYHGWVYNSDGVPVGIPDNEILFGLDSTARARLALRPVETATLGRFVFIRVDPAAEPLDDALGPTAALLSSVPLADAVLLEVSENSNGPMLTEASGGIRYRNLYVDAAAGGILAEISLPDGDKGVAVTRFRFGAPTGA